MTLVPGTPWSWRLFGWKVVGSPSKVRWRLGAWLPYQCVDLEHPVLLLAWLSVGRPDPGSLRELSPFTPVSQLCGCVPLIP